MQGQETTEQQYSMSRKLLGDRLQAVSLEQRTTAYLGPRPRVPEGLQVDPSLLGDSFPLS